MWRISNWFLFILFIFICGDDDVRDDDHDVHGDDDHDAHGDGDHDGGRDDGGGHGDDHDARGDGDHGDGRDDHGDDAELHHLVMARWILAWQ